MKKQILRGLIAFSFLFSALAIFAQNAPSARPSALNAATSFMKKQQSAWKLTDQDIANAVVKDAYQSANNGVTHVYMYQTHAGIELFNGVANFNVMANDKVIYSGNRFMPNLAALVNATEPTISPNEALTAAFKVLNLTAPTALIVKEKISDREFLFDKNNFLLADSHVKLCFVKVNDTQARLAWDLDVAQPDGNDHWSLRVDALTGAILEKYSWTTHCTFHPNAYHRTEDCTEDPLSIEPKKAVEIAQKPTSSPNAPLIGEGSYKVFPLPIESPAHGVHTLVVNPEDIKASPFGWHDDNGVAGAEYKYTRGNNVYAYLDVDNTNTPDAGSDSIVTKSDLVFDFPFLPENEAEGNKQAAITNLFYLNNMMHDITFRYGFDEKAGNFQFRNYTGTSGGGDGVRAEAQDASKTATPSLDNANFSTPPDGASGRMQMYLWGRPAVTDKLLLHVTAPSNLVGDFAAGSATFGPALTATPITGGVFFVNDASATPTYGCTALTNTNLTGKIAMIDRGGCFFVDKVLNAQKKGAIACIVCDFEESTAGLGGTNAAITIPAIRIKRSDCARLRVAADKGLTVSLYNSDAAVTGPDKLDGDFDNGIIAHEYGHGISARLTGGPQNTSCLNEGELAAGEGWSDFLGIALTVKPTDRGNTLRGVGTYVIRQSNKGVGIRKFQYSTDMSVSPLTYDNIYFSAGGATTPFEVHNVGEIWTTAVWEVYWAMVDQYGFDANLRNVNSGNGKALQLVMDGMKFQPCNPGFIEARDAILAADVADFNGENQCLIWTAFAKRGMGFDADGGKSSVSNDNTEGFAKDPACQKTLVLSKTVTENIKAGDPITVTLKLTNYKGSTATGIVVTDAFPDGTTFQTGSSSLPVTTSGSSLSWNAGSLNDGNSLILTYKITTDASKKSVVQFFDNLENPLINNWDVEAIVDGGNQWEISTTKAKSGTKSLGVTNSTKGISDQTVKLVNPILVSGKQPILSFYHNYDTENHFDCGIVQLSTNNGTSWQDAKDKIFKNPYNGAIDYSVFVVPNSRAFSGKSNGFVNTCVDLSSYVGQSVKVRFRFYNDSLVPSKGWNVDDIAFMDLLNYNSTARAVSAQKDTAFATAASRGSIVDPSVLTAVNDISADLNIQIYPNPTNDVLNINVLNGDLGKANVEITSVDGRIMWTTQMAKQSVKESILVTNIGAYPAGIYFVKVKTDNQVKIEKLFKY